MLATCGETQHFRGVGREFEHPVGEALGEEQFAGAGDAVGNFGNRVAGVFFVEATEGFGEAVGIGSGQSVLWKLIIKSRVAKARFN